MAAAGQWRWQFRWGSQHLLPLRASASSPSPAVPFPFLFPSPVALSFSSSRGFCPLFSVSCRPFLSGSYRSSLSASCLRPSFSSLSPFPRLSCAFVHPSPWAFLCPRVS
jgi:hypothetical protein